jgi:hypothetical protein
MTNPTNTNQASEDELRKGIIGELSRVQLYAKDHPYSVTATDESDIEKAADAIQSLIRTEKLKLLTEVRERVVGEDEKLVIPDYPKTDDEGEPLYSKRAAKEGRKQVTARYHTRKELRNDQRTELTKLEAEL